MLQAGFIDVEGERGGERDRQMVSGEYWRNSKSSIPYLPSQEYYYYYYYY